MDDLSGLLQNSTTPVNIPGSQLSNSISGNSFRQFSNKQMHSNNKNVKNAYFATRKCAGILQGTSAPVNIPGSSLNNFSPSNHTNMFNVSDPFSLSGSAPKINNSFGHNESLFFQQHIISPNLGDTLSMSPDLR